MTPKEKAQDLINKFLDSNYEWLNEYFAISLQIEIAKECTLITLGEILESLAHGNLSDSPYTTLKARQYFVEVKQEIEAL